MSAIAGPLFDWGCSDEVANLVQLSIYPRYGTVPLSVQVSATKVSGNTYPGAYTVSWGDGSSTNVASYYTSPTHTYSAAGTYQLSVQLDGMTTSGQVYVIGTTASAQNQSQLANALTALQGALQKLLELLK
jgi:PKD repeat protein